MNLSVLNLVPLRGKQTVKEAVDSMVELAKYVEKLGYTRYWVAEHHNTKKFASSATQLLIQKTLEHTEKIKVGSGGVMLPNHSPYLIAEQYGLLESLYPNRVDLGLGRAPGTDLATMRAIRVGKDDRPFPVEVSELRNYFEDKNNVHAYPAAGISIPMYILGSSVESAYLAAELGLPYAFASHFAPASLEDAVEIYRENFKPSKVLKEPYVIIGVNVILADTDKEAEKLSTTMTQIILDIITKNERGLQPPLENEQEVWKDFISVNVVPNFGPIAFNNESLITREKVTVEHMKSCSLIGSVETAKKQYAELRKKVNFDEIMAVTYIYDEKAQFHSYKLLKEVVAN